MSFSYFPYSPDETKAMKNPAIQLYGNRLFSDQTVSELLVEFLLVVFSPKQIGESGVFDLALPSPSQITEWNNERLEYAPKARLNLKLFSFLGASRLDSRHQTHRAHHEALLTQLQERINIAGGGDKEDIIRTIENLFLGFQGAGSGRTWCAQSFLPVSSGFLAGESIWKETKARNANIENWFDLIENRSSFFDMSQHLFLARGGELLYLQVCNALRQPQDQIVEWCDKVDLGLSQNEQDPTWLHTELEKALNGLMEYCPDTLTDLAEFVDSRLDSETPEQTDGSGEQRRFVAAGWCNADSWREGYLFAVDLLRLMKTNLDVVDRIYLLESACAMQVLRTLAMQSLRAAGDNLGQNGPSYRFAVSAPEEKRPVLRRLSHHSVKKVEKGIFQALRSSGIQLPEDETGRNKILKQADKAYGSKLFVGLAKRIGFVVPKRGAGARFILNEHLLRLLVVTTVPLGGRLTFDTFKALLEQRHGLVFDANGLDRASQWLSGKGIYLPADTDRWLQDMLEAAGFLIHLSDSCALIHNPADTGKDDK
ncbi:MAG: hypothetical protein H8E29_10160 [Anaerolineales bacterium]|uniref:Uncharacterized protein n=1 Tax=Candidatus Desulfolinea nitratireducens TaxID=2841698 RepID=A0A8J6NPB4_9CHLR|nr:hypothetical protein [Candidatus Desulfolinea nitratireducens]